MIIPKITNLKITFLIIFFSLLISSLKSDQQTIYIQKMLKAQGYSIGVIDGKSGKNTIREIKNWQHINNFDETGKIDNNQLSFLKIQYEDGKKLDNKELN